MLRRLRRNRHLLQSSLERSLVLVATEFAGEFLEAVGLRFGVGRRSTGWHNSIFQTDLVAAGHLRHKSVAQKHKMADAARCT